MQNYQKKYIVAVGIIGIVGLVGTIIAHHLRVAEQKKHRAALRHRVFEELGAATDRLPRGFPLEGEVGREVADWFNQIKSPGKTGRSVGTVSMTPRYYKELHAVLGEEVDFAEAFRCGNYLRRFHHDKQDVWDAFIKVFAETGAEEKKQWVESLLALTSSTRDSRETAERQLIPLVERAYEEVKDTPRYAIPMESIIERAHREGFLAEDPLTWRFKSDYSHVFHVYVNRGFEDLLHRLSVPSDERRERIRETQEKIDQAEGLERFTLLFEMREIEAIDSNSDVEWLVHFDHRPLFEALTNWRAIYDQVMADEEVSDEELLEWICGLDSEAPRLDRVSQLAHARAVINGIKARSLRRRAF